MTRSTLRWTSADVTDQRGRTAVVTGANSGIGFETARILAERGARVVLACRSLDKATVACDTIRATVPDADIHTVTLDLASAESVREAASAIRAEFDRIDLLINNAGAAFGALTLIDGTERTFVTNAACPGRSRRTGRHGQQRWPRDGPAGSRRPGLRAPPLQALERVRAIETCQPPVHFRTPAAVDRGGRTGGRGGGTPGCRIHRIRPQQRRSDAHSVRATAAPATGSLCQHRRRRRSRQSASGRRSRCSRRRILRSRRIPRRQRTAAAGPTGGNSAGCGGRRVAMGKMRAAYRCALSIGAFGVNGWSL